MNAIDLLHEVHQRGGEIHVDGDHVRVSAPKGALDDRLRETLIANKPDLILAFKLERWCGPLDVEPAEVMAAIEHDPDHTDGHVQQVLVRMHRDRNLRAGVVPEDWTATTHCHQCGDVPVPPELANGPALGCPWCFVDRSKVPRPRP